MSIRAFWFTLMIFTISLLIFLVVLSVVKGQELKSSTIIVDSSIFFGFMVFLSCICSSVLWRLHI